MKAKNYTKNYIKATEKLIKAIQELSKADDLEKIIFIAKTTVRELTGADSTAIVLREGNKCFYIDEDAKYPFWKGQKFPIESCISGLSMINQSTIVVEDINKDKRIEKSLYRNTQINSLLVVPIKVCDPIGTINCYWSNYHKPAIENIKLAQALADITAITMENAQVYSILEKHVEKRTKELEEANKELEIANQSLSQANQDLQTFSYTLSHDLKEPLNVINGFSRVILEKHSDTLNDKAKNYLTRVCKSAEQMHLQIDAVVELYKLSEKKIRKETVNLTEITKEIVYIMRENEPTHQIETLIEEDLTVEGDKILLYLVMQNLLSNAWKYSSKTKHPKIEIKMVEVQKNGKTFCVADNGVGFDMSQVEKLFSPFQRLHTQKDFPGMGLGLVSVKRIIDKHGGKIWLNSLLGKGTNVYFFIAN